MIEEEDDQPEDSGQNKKKQVPDDHEPVDPELPKKALANLRAVVKGNGLNPEALSLGNFHGEIVNFEAYQTYKLESTMAEKRVTGKENGEKAGSRQDAQQKNQVVMDRIAHDRDVKRMTASMLKKRQDIGFAVDNQVMNLRRYRKIYVVQEPCPLCEASGQITCQNCHGHRMIPCVKCKGHRDIQCHMCNGAQFINTPRGQQQCTYCHGRGRINCDMCRQLGEVQCPKCRATGKVPCQNCGATGWHSHLFVMDIKAKGRFSYDPNILPQELPPLIDEYGPRLVTEEHAQVRIIEEPAKDQEMDQRSKKGEYMIPYHAKLPWGDISFSARGKLTLKGHLFGYNALLVGLPPFLEDFIAKGLKALQNAAQGQGNVVKAVREAIRYRAIGETFLIASRAAPKLAANRLKERYPCGIREETLLDMATQARQAINHLTRKPRQKAFMIGSAITAALAVIYFFTPARAVMTESLGGIPDLLADLAVIIAGGAITTYTAQIMAHSALEKALGPLMKKDGAKKQIMPPASSSMFIAYPLAAIIFAVLLFASMQSGGETPIWLAGMLLK
ncbi:MAG: hypothetical protein H6867_02265 [Rhodospirillales bacterium]|nr:hypothetical protein [Rhodospirillales bacterium]MCB9997012.1 hypothetical protein [Rhodospirillales bacterium]